ncbi:TolB family protein [Kribbella sp. NBC_00359]|uniref:TolB family protein n=1 Tax=Kribbella sp. NBC_00359 TaxID=2975966 RepID=UPI002E22469F
MPQQGGAATMVIPGGADAAWSPDGTQIAFTAWRDPSRPYTPSGTTLAKADGSDARRLDMPSQSFDSSPSWAPDGSTILVERGALQGLDQRFVALQASGPTGEHVVLAFGPPDNGYSPRWGGALGPSSLLAGRGLDVHGGFGVPLASVPVADFAALNPRKSPASYSATVDWGDSSARSAATVALSGDPLKANGTVRADHTYASTGTYTLVTTLHRSGGGTSDESFTSHAFIAWGALVAAQPVFIPAGIPVKGLLAVLSYPSSLGVPPPAAPAFTNWNDAYGPGGTTQELRTLEVGPSGGVITVGVYERNGHSYPEIGAYTPLLRLPGWGIRSVPRTAELTVPLSVQVHKGSEFRMDPPSASPLLSPVLFYPELDAIPAGWGAAEFDWEFPGRGGAANTTFADTPAKQQQFQRLLDLVKSSGNNLDDKSVRHAMQPFGIEPTTFDLWKDNFPRHILVHVFTDDAVPHDITLTVKLTDLATYRVETLNWATHSIHLVDGPTCLRLNYLIPPAPAVSFALVGNHTTCDLIAALKAIVRGPTRSPDYISADISGGSDASVAGLTVTVTQSGEVYVSFHRGLGTPGVSAAVIYGYFGLPNDPPPENWKVDRLIDGWTYTAGVVGSTVAGEVSLGETVVLGTTGFGWNAFEYAMVGGLPSASGQASCAVHLGSDSEPPLRWLKYLQPTRTDPFPGRSVPPAVPTPTGTQATDLLARSRTLLNNAATCNSVPPPPG